MRVLLVLATLAACAPQPPEPVVTTAVAAIRTPRGKVDPAPARALLPETDVGAQIDPDRNIWLSLPDGRRVQVTNLPGAEDAEALSPDGTRVAFLAGASGLAAVWVAEVPGPGEPVRPAQQLTNEGLEDEPRAPGRMPAAFVPPPEAGRLRWRDGRTIEWEAQGRTWTAELR